MMVTMEPRRLTIHEGKREVRLSDAERQQILLSVQSLESQVAGFHWHEIALFGSRTRLDERGGDIDLYIRMDRVPDVPVARLKRELRIELADRLGEQKFDLVMDDGNEDLGAFGEVILREKVELWRQN